MTTDYERAVQFRNNASKQYNLETRLTWQGFLDWLKGISSDMVRIAEKVERTMGHVKDTMGHAAKIADLLSAIISRL